MLPKETKFVSGMKLNVCYLDQTKLRHERIIELLEILPTSSEGLSEGRTKWMDITGAYWTEGFLLENATLVEKIKSKKNFDEIKVGHWYVKRNGELMRLCERHESVWEPDGTYNEGEESPYDLMQEVEAPILVPVKRKVKKEIVGAALVFPSGVISHYASLEDAEASLARSNPNKFTVVKLTGTYETEE